MLKRISLGAVALAGLAMAIFTGCSATGVDSIQISPASQSLAVGQTVQFKATGVVGHGQHPSSSEDVTTMVTWTSSAPAIATVDSTGLATAASSGTTTITASMNGFPGVITATATVTVTNAPSGSTTADVTSISIIPGTQSVAAPGGTAQFIAIGTTSTGSTIDVTSSAAWTSSSPQIAKVSASGLATGLAQGSTTITAVYSNPDKTVATGTATFQVTSGNGEQVTALTMFPTSQAATAAAQQSQFTVLATENGLQYDVTSQVAWASSNLAVATVGTSGSGTPGLATAVGAGTTSITATYTNKDGSQVIATATYTVTIGSGQEPLLSINIIPNGITVSNKGMTGQFMAIGTFSTAPTVRDITNQVTWISLLPNVASITTYGVSGAPGSGGASGEIGGLATAEGYTGTSDIYAEMTNPDGTVVLSNSQSFTCSDAALTPAVCNPNTAAPETFATVTLYIAGENTSSTGEYVTAPSDTGTPNLIHCGPDWTGSGGQVCTGTYEVGSTVTLTENLPAGSSYFGGWSTGAGCTEPNLATSTTCTFTLTGDHTVGVIFY